MFKKLPSVVPGVTISEAFKGHNASRQYISSLEYHSVIVEKKEKIKIEVGIREPLLRPSESRLASTIVINPFNGQPLPPPLQGWRNDAAGGICGKDPCSHYKKRAGNPRFF
jgi:hypothetical protein